MIIAWRLVPEPRKREAFTGEGSRLYGGRWNHRGSPVVYVSESLALAVLEQFVNVGFEGRYMQYIYMRIEVPDSIKMETIGVKSLPAGWNDLPVLSATMDIGSNWIRKSESAILKVPSAIVPVEYNYMLNPQHHDFKKIKIGEPQSFRLDPRMCKTGS